MLFALSRVSCANNPKGKGLLSVLVPVWSDAIITAMRNYYDLTGAGIEVLPALAGGKNATQVAAIRDTSIHTVRSQIKSILTKMRLEMQLDLIRRWSNAHGWRTSRIPVMQAKVLPSRGITNLRYGQWVPLIRAGKRQSGDAAR